MQKSIFDKNRPYIQEEAQFVPPEALGSLFEAESIDELIQSEKLNAWDIAIRYHELKSKKGSHRLKERIRAISARAILERAEQLMGSAVHPKEIRYSPFNEVPSGADQIEMDLDETLENSPLISLQPRPEDIWMSYLVHRKQPVILCVDTSLSMTGEKLALTAIALAVVLLEFSEDPLGIVAFENEASILKRPEEKLTVETLVQRFLDVPAQGYTHLEDGMKMALQLLRTIQGSQTRPPSVVLLTDGKYTAGKDPSYLAPRFPHLILLKMGAEKASRSLCQDLARLGHGRLKEIEELEALPTAMYAVVKDLLRGRSLQ